VMHANTPIPASPETQVTRSLLAHGLARVETRRHCEAARRLQRGVPAADGCGSRDRDLQFMYARDERRLKHPTDTRVFVKFSVSIGRNTIVRDRNVSDFGVEAS